MDVCPVLCNGDFYPRPPRGGRRSAARTVIGFETISIHALREEGDPEALAELSQMTLISIHALREEGDPQRANVRAREM